MSEPRLRGLYAITDSTLIPPTYFREACAAALRGGARVVQYRDKGQDHATRRRQARELVALCRKYGALTIINDDVQLAAHSQAHGVHLGRNDAGLREARQRLGNAAIIGVSCYGSLERATRAASMGADYLAFGRFFPSQTKPDATPVSLELLRQARQLFPLPLVAIGGILPENAPPLLATGADLLAVVHGLFGHPDVEAAAQRYNGLFAPRALDI